MAGKPVHLESFSWPNRAAAEAYFRSILRDGQYDVGERITDQTLTLQLIRGLNRKFHIMATLLSMQSPFPTFAQARSRLLME